jgi:hypothetical protein
MTFTYTVLQNELWINYISKSLFCQAALVEGFRLLRDKVNRDREGIARVAAYRGLPIGESGRKIG